MAKQLNIAELTADGSRYKRTLKGLENETKRSAQKIQSEWGKLSSSIGKVAGAFGIAFGAQQLIRFSKEAVTLAGKVQGVKEAFDKLNKPSLLDDLRRATRGTVDDLQLMQTAVQAENFNIPLSQLATLLEFAQKRATQTGESVDYLVDSIVTGIGRKSVMILDNLGISAAELQEEIKKVGDFGLATGNIIARELENMGNVSETTTDKLARITAGFNNMKATIGQSLTPAMDGLLDQFQRLMETDLETTIRQLKSLNVSDEQLRRLSMLNTLLETQSQLESTRKVLNLSTDLGPRVTGFENPERDDFFISEDSFRRFESSLKTLSNDSVEFADKLNLINKETEDLTRQATELAELRIHAKNVEDIDEEISRLNNMLNRYRKVEVALTQIELQNKAIKNAQELLTGSGTGNDLADMYEEAARELDGWNAALQDAISEQMDLNLLMSSYSKNASKGIDETKIAFEKLYSDLRFLAQGYINWKKERIEEEYQSILKKTQDEVNAEIWKYERLKELNDDYRNFLGIDDMYSAAGADMQSDIDQMDAEESERSDMELHLRDLKIRSADESTNIMLNGAIKFGDLLSRASDVFGSSFLGTLSKGMTFLSGFISAVASAASGGGGIGGVFGIVSSLIPGLASGGTAYANQPHIVGEHGPELFIPGVTGTVIPNIGTQALNIRSSNSQMLSKLDRVTSAIFAMNDNISRTGGQRNTFLLSVNGKVIGEIVQGEINKLTKSGKNLQDL